MAVRLDPNTMKGEFCFITPITAKTEAPHTTIPTLSLFSWKDLLYDVDSSEYKTGVSNQNAYATPGNGQMSMLLIEMYFLSKCLPKTRERVTVVYAGAHPGDHINHLIEMFPNVLWHLYDPFTNERDQSEMDTPLRLRERVIEEPIYIDSEHITKGKVVKHHIALSDDEARRFGQEDDNVYFISDIRNREYGKRGSEKDSEILESDTYNQLRWAEMMNAKWSLLRFRPKLKDERMYKDSDSQTERDKKSCYVYPRGRFIKIPMQKKNQHSMFFIAGGNNPQRYTPTIKYYHEDMIEMINHFNYTIRTSYIYDNPDTGTFDGYLNEQDINDFIRQVHITTSDQTNRLEFEQRVIADARKYICAMDFDHRAMLEIVILYFKWKGGDYSKRDIMKVILLPYISMDKGKASKVKLSFQ
jgi:hypothetical protein